MCWLNSVRRIPPLFFIGWNKNHFSDLSGSLFLSLFNLVHNWNIGVPNTSSIQTSSTTCKKLGWSAQKWKNLKGFLTWGSSANLITIREWSDTPAGRKFASDPVNLLSHSALTSALSSFLRIGPSSLLLDQEKNWPQNLKSSKSAWLMHSSRESIQLSHSFEPPTLSSCLLIALKSPTTSQGLPLMVEA